MMLWTHISALQSWIRTTSTSRPVFNFSEVARPMGLLFKQVLLFLKMFILKLTKLLVLLDRLVLNGVIRVHNSPLQDRLQDRPQTIGGVGSLRLIHHLTPLTLTTNGIKLVDQALYQALYHHTHLVLDKQSK